MYLTFKRPILIHIAMPITDDNDYDFNSGERLSDREVDEIMTDTDTTPDLDGNVKFEGIRCFIFSILLFFEFFIQSTHSVLFRTKGEGWSTAN